MDLFPPLPILEMKYTDEVLNVQFSFEMTCILEYKAQMSGEKYHLIASWLPFPHALKFLFALLVVEGSWVTSIVFEI